MWRGRVSRTPLLSESRVDYSEVRAGRRVAAVVDSGFDVPDEAWVEPLTQGSLNRTIIQIAAGIFTS